MRAGLAASVLALGLCGCKPRVDPRSPFDEDDPRAASAARTPTTTTTTVTGSAAPDRSAPIAIPGGGARTGTVSREDLRVHLDAGPADFLRWFDVEAEVVDGTFTGWRLVRLLSAGRPLAAYDLQAGDVLRTINGRAVSKPSELAALWLELYGAPAIVAELSRGGAKVELRIDIEGAPLPPPATAPTAPAPLPPP